MFQHIPGWVKHLPTCSCQSSQFQPPRGLTLPPSRPAKRNRPPLSSHVPLSTPGKIQEDPGGQRSNDAGPDGISFQSPRRSSHFWECPCLSSGQLEQVCLGQVPVPHRGLSLPSRRI